MTVYCLFCGTLMETADTAIRVSGVWHDEWAVQCATCFAKLRLMIQDECLRRVAIVSCGKRCLDVQP